MAIMCIPVLPQQEMTISEFKVWLRRFDSDKDGRLNRDELQQVLHSLNKWFSWWKTGQAMKEADVNGDGVIDQDEIVKLVDYARKHLHMKIHGGRKY